MGFVGRISGQNHESDFPRLDHLQTLFTGDKLAARGHDARYSYYVAVVNTSASQSQLERLQLLLVFTRTFSQEEIAGYHFRN